MRSRGNASLRGSSRITSQGTMGSSASRPSPLAPTFERMASWDMKAAKRLLSDYKEKDLDFGLDAQGLAEICGGDVTYADTIIDAFGGTNGIVNALAYICGAILVSSGAALEKAGLVFDALDFDMTEQISMDEMTIVLLCSARGFCVMSGTGKVPSDEALENVTLQAYRELSKSGGLAITKTEFTKWIIKYVAAAPTAVPHAEVTIEDMAVQFGLVVMPAAKSFGEDVLSELAAENNTDSGLNIQETSLQEESPVQEDTAIIEPQVTEEPKHLEADDHQQDEFRPAEEITEDAIAASPEQDANPPGGPLQYADEFQAETPRDEEWEEQRPPSPLVGEADAEAPAPPHLEFPVSELMEDQQAPPDNIVAEDAPANAAVDGEPAIESVRVEPESDSPRDLNAFETYDYADPVYDSSSGLMPPDPFENHEEVDQPFEPSETAQAEEADGVPGTEVDASAPGE